jgi:hypothetical protein
VLYVQNDEDVYVWWLDRNDPGFVANLHTGRKNRAMLHRTRCWHLYPPEPNRVHTVTNPKACSRNRDEVERWLSENGFETDACPDCRP